jgi:ubiquinone/menaquinone biosynthesis C-methylase UbiE
LTVLEANNLIQNGAGNAAGETWADLGAGEGTFTLALAQLVGEQGRVIAVDHDVAAIRELRRISQEVPSPPIDVVAADVTRLKLPDVQLDGALLANVLHFIEDPTTVLARVRQHLRPGGRVLVVEYDRRARSNWVPFPLPMSRLDMIASAAGLAMPVEVGRRKSRYQGELYCALLQR